MTIKRTVVDWDLSVVLTRLTLPPFEPMKTASFQLITYKTLFLFALASIKRRGEIHACTWASFQKLENWFAVETDPSFLFKTAAHVKHYEAMGRIEITGLKSLTSTRDDKLLCPVRAMKLYIKKAERFRWKGQVRLFIPITRDVTKQKEISREMISSWLRRTILMCLRLAGCPPPRVSVTAYSVRRAGASLAFLSKVPLDTILRAGTWKVATTFLRYYLAALSPRSGGPHGVHRLGPIAAAGAVVTTQ